MNCAEAREATSLLMDGQLDKITEETVRRHLEDCQECAIEFAIFKNITKETMDLPMMDLPENFHGELMHKINNVKPKRIFHMRWQTYATMAASLLFLLSILSIFSTMIKNSPSSTLQSAPNIRQFASQDDGATNGEQGNMDIMESAAPEEQALLLAEPGVFLERQKISDGKIIKTMDISIEVQHFDDIVQNLKALVQSYGGYVQNYESYVYQKDMERNIRLQSGFMRVRIPAEQYGVFSNHVAAMGSVVNRHENAEDITEQYVDIESRIRTKKIEEERILAILADSSTLEDLLKLEERLSFIRNDIETMEAQIKNFDKRISYSTININLTETPDNILTGIFTTPDNFSAKVGKEVINGINEFKFFIMDVIIFLAGRMMQIIFLVIFIFLMMLTIKRIVRR